MHGSWSDHPAIIPKETFLRVQDEIERRKGGRATGGSVFSGRIFCGECGELYGPKVWHSNDPYRKTVWRCNGKYENKCGTPTLHHDDLRRAFESVLATLGKEKMKL